MQKSLQQKGLSTLCSVLNDVINTSREGENEVNTEKLIYSSRGPLTIMKKAITDTKTHRRKNVHTQKGQMLTASSFQLPPLSRRLGVAYPTVTKGPTLVSSHAAICNHTIDPVCLALI